MSKLNVSRRTILGVESNNSLVIKLYGDKSCIYLVSWQRQKEQTDTEAVALHDSKTFRMGHISSLIICHFDIKCDSGRFSHLL